MGLALVYWANLLGQFINFFIAKYVCVCPNFVNGDIMGGDFYCIYGANNEEFVRVVKL